MTTQRGLSSLHLALVHHRITLLYSFRFRLLFDLHHMQSEIPESEEGLGSLASRTSSLCH